MPRTLRRWSFLKKPPGHLGSDPGGPPERHPDRAVVAGRGPCRPERKDRPPLGQTGSTAPRPAPAERSAPPPPAWAPLLNQHAPDPSGVGWGPGRPPPPPATLEEPM